MKNHININDTDFTLSYEKCVQTLEAGTYGVRRDCRYFIDVTVILRGVLHAKLGPA